MTLAMKHIRCFLIVILCGVECMARRGPHHPHSTVDRHKQQHATEHLTYHQDQHIEEDLNTQHITKTKPIEEMTEDEKNYLFFKVHDLDGNDKLDGLEIYYSATHHSVSQDVDETNGDTNDDKSENVFAIRLQEDQMNTGIDPSNLRMLESDNNGELIDKNFNHIIEILDNFLNVADLNQDGYLNFPEYAAAVKLGNAMAAADIY